MESTAGGNKEETKGNGCNPPSIVLRIKRLLGIVEFNKLVNCNLQEKWPCLTGIKVMFTRTNTLGVDKWCMFNA